MAKVQIKSEKLTPFGGIFSIMEQFDSMLSPIIDQTLGQRCSSIIGYQYSEIIRSLMSVYFCGGSCVEDVHLVAVSANCTVAVDIPMTVDEVIHIAVIPLAIQNHILKIEFSRF